MGVVVDATGKIHVTPNERKVKNQGRLLVNENEAIWKFPKDPWYKVNRFPSLLPPWSKLRKGLEKLSEAQREVIRNFVTVASATGGINRDQRRAIIAQVLAGKTSSKSKQKKAPGRKLSPEEMKSLVTELSGRVG